MPNETPDKMDWKNKLAELDNHDSDVFNKEALWIKLHVRLQPKQKKKKVVWYWVAAACLFFTLSLTFLLSKKKENVLVQNNLLQKDIKSSVSPKLIINKEASNNISSLNQYKQPDHFYSINNKANTSIHKKITKTELIYHTNEKEKIMAHVLDDEAIKPMDSTISIAVNLPEKKKLKVVHVNEIGEPVVEIANTERVYDRHNFQFKFMNQQGIASSSFSSNNKILKIFTSQNAPVK